MQPHPLGQSLPDVHLAVQTLGPVRQPKLHADGSVHARPTSLIRHTRAPPPPSSQRIPAGQLASLAHDSVQRFVPPFVIVRQSPLVHSPSAAQTSSTALVGPPVDAEVVTPVVEPLVATVDVDVEPGPVVALVMPVDVVAPGAPVLVDPAPP